MTSEEARGELIGLTRIVCTGRRSHKLTRLADIRWYPERGWQVTAPVRGNLDEHNSWEVMTPVEEDGSDGEEWVYEFWCTRCHRNPRISRTNWLKLLEAINPNTWDDTAWRAGGRSDLDLSSLPF